MKRYYFLHSLPHTEQNLSKTETPNMKENPESEETKYSTSVQAQSVWEWLWFDSWQMEGFFSSP
jgi:hypothetical protein